MEEIFKQYGSTIITVLAILTVIGVMVLVIGSDNTSIVYKEFSTLIESFYEKAAIEAGLGGTP